MQMPNDRAAGTWVAPPGSMQASNVLLEEVPGLEGPDYVALVIEWDEAENQITLVNVPRVARRVAPTEFAAKIAAVVGAVGALALATWGLRRLSAA